MNQESKQNAMRQRHHERDFQIFVELVLNGSHKPEGHIWSTPMVFQESSKRYEYSLKRTKKYIKITREKRVCHRQPNDKNIILPQAGSTKLYGRVTIIVLSLKVSERCCWLSRGSPLRYGWKGTGPPYEKKKEPDELVNICVPPQAAPTHRQLTQGGTQLLDEVFVISGIIKVEVKGKYH